MLKLLSSVSLGVALVALAGCQDVGPKSTSTSGLTGGMALPPEARVTPVTREAVKVMADEDLVIKHARDLVYPATVRVEAHKTDYFGGQKKRIGGFGSGVIFDAQGHVLTNYHVAGRAEELSCTLYNKERVKAKLIGADPWTDLAVMQLDLGECKEKCITFPFAKFGDSAAMSEGDAVLAIGSPFGLSRSISSGIISCHDRVLGEAMDLGGGLETGLFSTWIQTDAAINPGNSGGPLVNLKGEVIGVNTRGGGNDLGFAVPIDVAKDVIRQILEKGKVTRSDIGLRFQPLQDLEAFFDVGKTEGAIISAVEPGSPAANADIQPRDILLEYNGVKVAGRFPEELFQLRRMVADTRVGARATLKIKRGTKILPVTLTTVELTTVRSDEVNFDKWGLVGQNITGRLAERENLKDRRGVYITGVRAGEPGEKAKIADGDVIFRIGDKEVEDVDQLKKAYDESIEKKQALVLVKVRRGPAVVTAVLKVDVAETPKAKAEDKAEDKGEKKAEKDKTDAGKTEKTPAAENRQGKEKPKADEKSKDTDTLKKPATEPKQEKSDKPAVEKSTENEAGK